MIVYGKNVAKEILNNKKEIKKIYLSDNFNDEEILNKIKNLKITILSKKEMDKMVKENHQGIILEINDYEYASLECILQSENPLIVILDHIEDPHNLGAIIRTGEAAGVDGIIIPKNRSVQVNSTVMKTSAGALENVKLCMVTNLANTIEKLKKQGFWFVGTDMEGTPYKDIDYSSKTCIIIGNEGFGMSRLIKEQCDFIATIPMKGKVNSLNASVAAGIIIFEAVSKRK